MMSTMLMPVISDGGTNSSVSDNDSNVNCIATDQNQVVNLQATERDSSNNQTVKKSVNFDGVTVYYFPRIQGYTCVPSQGGSTLGMGERHTSVEMYSLNEYANMQHSVHRDALLEHHKQGLIVLPENFEEVSRDWTFDEYYFLQPVPARQRRVLLHEAGVSSIDPAERDECRIIRASRSRCGCACRMTCDARTCSCYRAGIRCQVDQMSCPCGCTGDGCSNSFGRVEFNAARVRAHFLRTLLHLEVIKDTGNIPFTSSDFSFDIEQSTDGGSNIGLKRWVTGEDKATDVKRRRLDDSILVAGSSIDLSMDNLRTERVYGELTSESCWRRESPDFLSEVRIQSSSKACEQIGASQLGYCTDDLEIPAVGSNTNVSSLRALDNEHAISTDHVPAQKGGNLFESSVGVDKNEDVGDVLQQVSGEIVSLTAPKECSGHFKQHSNVANRCKSQCLPSFIKPTMSLANTIEVSNLCSSSSDQSFLYNESCEHIERRVISSLNDYAGSDDFNFLYGVTDSLIPAMNFASFTVEQHPTVITTVSSHYLPCQTQYDCDVTGAGYMTAAIVPKIKHDSTVVRTSGESSSAGADVEQNSGCHEVNPITHTCFLSEATEVSSPSVKMSCEVKSDLCNIAIDQCPFDTATPLVKSSENCFLQEVDKLRLSPESITENNHCQILAISHAVAANKLTQFSACEEFACSSEFASELVSNYHLSGIERVELRLESSAKNSIASYLASSSNCSELLKEPCSVVIDGQSQNYSRATTNQSISMQLLSEPSLVSLEEQSVVSAMLLSEQLKFDSGLMSEEPVAASFNFERFTPCSEFTANSFSMFSGIEEDSECCLHAATEPSEESLTDQTCDTVLTSCFTCN